MVVENKNDNVRKLHRIAVVVADAMRCTRAAYQYANRKAKKDEESTVKERMADAVLRDSCRNFWSEIKRIRRNRAGVSNSLDGLTDVNDIAPRLFTVKYRELYTSVPYGKADKQAINDELNASLADVSISRDCVFSFGDVKTAVKRMKPGNSEAPLAPHWVPRLLGLKF